MKASYRSRIVCQTAIGIVLLSSSSSGAALAQNASVKALPQGKVLPAASVVSEVYLARVERVIDGGTLVVQPEDRKEKKRTLHLFGVHSPTGTEAQAKEARDFLHSSAQGKRVRVETRLRNKDGSLASLVTLLPPAPPRAPFHMEPTGIRPDMPRGRETMGTASSALLPPETERNLNYGLLRAGLARRNSAQLQTDQALSDQFMSAEKEAMEDKVGLWAAASRSKAARKP